MVKILAFDTETSDRAPYIPGTTTWIHSKKLLSIQDLKKSNSMWSTLLVDWPSILQLSYVLYDTENPGKSKIFNKYIDIEEHVQISAESLAIHHITREKIAKAVSINRATIQDAIKEFLKDVKIADVVVGHNVAFDRKMVVAELIRLTQENNSTFLDDEIIEMMKNKKFKCTQEITRPLCKLQIGKKKPNKTDKTDKNEQKKEYYKYKTPKLIEAYKHFFGCSPNPELLHDALIDAIITLRVYCISLKKNPFDINHTNKTITSYITKVSPATCKHVSKKQSFKKSNNFRTRKSR